MIESWIFWAILMVARKLGWTIPAYTNADHRATMAAAEEQFQALQRQRQTPERQQ